MVTFAMRSIPDSLTARQTTLLAFCIALFFITTGSTFETKSNMWVRAKQYASYVTNDIDAILRCWKLRWAGIISKSSPMPNQWSSKTPIILVHGYGHDNTGWTEFRKRLEGAGLGPVFAPTLSRSFDDIRYSASEIAAWVKMVKMLTQKEHVILIGHSMGGLASSYCTQNLLEQGCIKAVITLATPFQGTKVASLGFGKAAFQMQPEHPFIKGLSTQIRTRPKTRYICLGSRVDEAVRPFTAAFAHGLESADSILYDTVGHSQMLFSNHVFSDVVQLVTSLEEPLVWRRKAKVE